MQCPDGVGLRTPFPNRDAAVPRALKICSCSGCPAHPGRCTEATPAGRCTPCAQAAEQLRGTAAERGYGRHHDRRFHRGVIRKDPLCVCVDEHRSADGTGHGKAGCLAPSQHADHHPRDRDELVRLGLNPNDPQYGRGLCASCHAYATSQAQPGGWNAR